MKAQDQGQFMRYLATTAHARASVKHGIHVSRSTPLQVRLKVEGLSPKPARVRIVASAICRRELDILLLTRIIAASVTIGLVMSLVELRGFEEDAWEETKEALISEVVEFLKATPSTRIS